MTLQYLFGFDHGFVCGIFVMMLVLHISERRADASRKEGK